LRFFVSSVFSGASAYKLLRGHHDSERDAQTRIIGGNEANTGEYPYAVSLSSSYFEDAVSPSGHFCGGSLIGPDVVLSAAHCAVGGAFYNVTVGRHALNSTEGEVIAVKAEAPHPDYNPITTDYDFMLIFLNETVNHDVEFVKLHQPFLSDTRLQTYSSDRNINFQLTVMGWGDITASDDVFEMSKVLMETEVNLITNEECARSNGTIYGTETNYNDQITENMLCAKDLGEDSCQGDSGGPLVFKSIQGADVQVGVVSWGMGCAHEDFRACILASRPPTIGSEK